MMGWLIIGGLNIETRVILLVLNIDSLNLYFLIYKMDPPQNLSIDYLDLLPDELLVEILLKTDDLETISRLCRTSKRINLICQDKFFWHRKYQKDFGFGSHGGWGLSGLSGDTILVEGETWQEKYKRMILSGINSPISAGNCGGYGIIDQNGNLYMKGMDSLLVISQQPNMMLSSKISHLVKFPSKVISISVSSSLAGAVTKDGKAYIWGRDNGEPYFPFKGYIRVTPEPKELPNNKKATRIEVSKLGYIMLLEDSSVYHHVYRPGRMYFQGIINVEAVDISIGDNLYAIITKNGDVLVGGRGIYDIKFPTKNTTVFLKIPEPAIRVVSTLRSVMILSATGKVYKWVLRNRNGNGSLKLIELPEPIVQISSGGRTFAALSKTGKLYMWGYNRHNKISSDNQSFRMIDQIEHTSNPVEISFGLPINFVSVGWDFTIAVSNDGTVNYWGNSLWAPE